MSAMVSFRSVVDPTDCDFLGHMNVSRYFAACSDGILAIQSEMGLTANDMRTGRRVSFAVVNAQSDFRAELTAGDSIRLETEVVAIGSKSMTFRHRLFRADGNKMAFETEFKCVLLSLETRQATKIPNDIRERAANWMENPV
ncbi:thioesterase family protein [uncultured Ruegeria sp.]|uniref:acyl-CoA thioesterase n=1 Tax=uncultured Ruegeria sp. TaxID=259304 RepID=UPI00263A12AB|nr:thioesterase family protein [uncultured Ruegeria sp.]